MVGGPQALTDAQDENLKLREELNASKKRVIELKQAAHQRKLTWKEELDKITEELSSKQKLEGEVAAMRQQMVDCKLRAACSTSIREKLKGNN